MTRLNVWIPLSKCCPTAITRMIFLKQRADRIPLCVGGYTTTLSWSAGGSSWNPQQATSYRHNIRSHLPNTDFRTGGRVAGIGFLDASQTHKLWKGPAASLTFRQRYICSSSSLLHPPSVVLMKPSRSCHSLMGACGSQQDGQHLANRDKTMSIKFLNYFVNDSPLDTISWLTLFTWRYKQVQINTKERSPLVLGRINLQECVNGMSNGKSQHATVVVRNKREKSYCWWQRSHGNSRLLGRWMTERILILVQMALHSAEGALCCSVFPRPPVYSLPTFSVVQGDRSFPVAEGNSPKTIWSLKEGEGLASGFIGPTYLLLLSSLITIDGVLKERVLS